MVVNPISYDVQQGQKTLYKYDKKEGVRLQEYKQQQEVKEVDDIVEEKQTELGNGVSEDKQQENT